MARRRRQAKGLLVLSLLAALGGSQCPTSALTPTDTAGVVSFSRDIQAIFDAHCIRCHVTGGFANNSGIPLRLVEGVSYGLLVNRKSVQRPDLTLVVPGDADNSLLYLI